MVKIGVGEWEGLMAGEDDSESLGKGLGRGGRHGGKQAEDDGDEEGGKGHPKEQRKRQSSSTIAPALPEVENGSSKEKPSSVLGEELPSTIPEKQQTRVELGINLEEVKKLEDSEQSEFVKFLGMWGSKDTAEVLLNEGDDRIDYIGLTDIKGKFASIKLDTFIKVLGGLKVYTDPISGKSGFEIEATGETVTSETNPEEAKRILDEVSIEGRVLDESISVLIGKFNEPLEKEPIDAVWAEKAKESEKPLEDVIHLSLDKDALKKYAGVEGKKWVDDFIKMWGSGKVARIEFDIVREGKFDRLKTMRLIAEDKSEASLPIYMLSVLFSNCEQYRGRLYNGPNDGVRFIPDAGVDKGFKYVVPGSDPKIVEDFLSNTEIEGKKPVQDNNGLKVNFKRLQ